MTSRRPSHIDHIVQGRFDLPDLFADAGCQIDGIEKTETIVDQDTDIPIQPADQFETVGDELSHGSLSVVAILVEDHSGMACLNHTIGIICPGFSRVWEPAALSHGP
jgi:hypothetical protein